MLKRVVLFIISLFIISLQVLPKLVAANNCATTDYDCQIAAIQKEIEALSPAHENNKQELTNLNKQIADIKYRINVLSGQLSDVSNEIDEREEDLAFAQEVFESKAHHHYRFLRMYDPIMPFLSSDSASSAFIEITVQQRAADGDRQTMEEYGKELLQLKADKESLENNQKSLASAQASINSRATFLAGEIEKVEGYLTELSAKQQEILAAKAGSFTTSVGNVELADDYNASIKGFRESAPGGSFAVFSFGGYTHRKGMSQYGARGRAENGQNYSQILQFYYGKSPVTKDTSGNINVSGVGSINFEDYYLLGIAEMPSSWHVEALKAQAIAARTYAYRYKVQGSSICTTEACQVFNSGKANNPPEAWRQAVQATRGQVLEDVTTFYSSTAGGYSYTSGWDTTDGNGGSNFIDKAWEAKGGSPWLYKAWYRQGYSSSGATCAKSNPWLTSAELADIVNAALALKKGGVDISRISPTSCFGGNPYSTDELRNVSGGISSVNSVSVLQGNGVTNEVVINGNIRMSGIEFKKGFNLRAPGYLRIPQGDGFGSGTDFAFFNIEKK